MVYDSKGTVVGLGTTSPYYSTRGGFGVGAAAGPVEIGDGAWLGENVVVGPGVCIGRGAVIGANAVVLDDVPERSVAVGAPARIVRSLGDASTPAVLDR